ncbi:XRE family transcriptional regulator, partial [Butyricicoccus sp. 1XD8-22]
MEFPKALVGNLIREARKDSSLTVEELANKIGVSQSMV